VWCNADLRRRLGCALLRLDPPDVARAKGAFRRALEIARSQSARLFELRAARDLARLRRDQGRLAEARGLLAPVYAAFTEGYAFPDLMRRGRCWKNSGRRRRTARADARKRSGRRRGGTASSGRCPAVDGTRREPSSRFRTAGAELERHPAPGGS
jgi:hypothetical protein